MSNVDHDGALLDRCMELHAKADAELELAKSCGDQARAALDRCKAALDEAADAQAASDSWGELSIQHRKRADQLVKEAEELRKGVQARMEARNRKLEGS